MKKFSISLFLVLKVFNTWAQPNQEIKGRVVDSRSQHPLREVVVRVVDAADTARTTAAGYFLLKTATEGTQTVQVYKHGYRTKQFLVDTRANKPLDLGIIPLEEDLPSGIERPLTSLAAVDLEEQYAESENSSGLTASSSALSLQRAALEWSAARYQIRGLDGKYHRVLVDGIPMNKAHDGRSLWSNWSGHHHLLIRREFTLGTATSGRDFGGILGTQNIETRASSLRKGGRFSLGSSTFFRYKSMLSYVSSSKNRRWHYAISATKAEGNAGAIEGTAAEVSSVLLAVEKQFNSRHHIHFTTIYGYSKRGKSSALTDEVTELMGPRYNPYWGWQGSYKRNSRFKVVAEPLFTLAHYWTFDDKTQLTTTLAVQTGMVGNSSLGYRATSNPDPTHYKNLPSYFLSYHNSSGIQLGHQQPYLGLATAARAYFLDNSQINWTQIYRDNQQNGYSRIILYQDRTDDQTHTVNIYLQNKRSQHLSLYTGLGYQGLRSENYRLLTDLLGGSAYLDTDYAASQAQTDLNSANRPLGVGDRFGYHYRLQADFLQAFMRLSSDYRRLQWAVAVQASRTGYRREGLTKNDNDAELSDGKSAKKIFTDYGIKAEATYRLNRRHRLGGQLAYTGLAPTLNTVFSNARLSNQLAPGVTSENTLSAAAQYSLQTNAFKARIGGYLIEIKNAAQLSFHYSEGISGLTPDGTLSNASVSELLTEIDKRHLGGELSAEYSVSPAITIAATAAVGQYFYTNNPRMQLQVDRWAQTVDYGSTRLKNYRIASGPQTAASLSITYTPPTKWWLRLVAAYLDNNYTALAPIRRTDYWIANPENPNNSPYTALTAAELRTLLQQEKLHRILQCNFTMGKQWRRRKKALSAFLSVENLFDMRYKIGGFESARNANYKAYAQDYYSGNPAFGNRYTHGAGRLWYGKIYYQF
ncbi:carboxypeptidase regulatory-like domain-containing protein [Flavobacterium sp. JP2137]|uniref:carboxypeptidase regulatory-like domain-containing protein n=1 Tax=Flavobacterium sp. JP2137 TaxID=3414510 RepID=UPI003D2FAF0C